MNRRYFIVLLICIIVISMPSIAYSLSMAEDTIPPDIITQAQDLQVSCGTIDQNEALLIEWYNNYGGLLATDENSDTIIYSASLELDTVMLLFNNSNGCGNTKAVTVDFFAEDDCQNKTGASTATFSLVDNESPLIVTQASPLTLSCGPGMQDSLEAWILEHGGSVADDDCSDFIDWLRFTYSDNLGNSGVGFIGLNVIPIPDSICNWRVDVSFIVIDGCGNQGVTTSFFEIIDDVFPSFSYLPEDTVVGCEGLPLINDLEGFDYCTDNPSMNYEEIEQREGTVDSCSFYNYTLLRTWDVADACGNVSSYSQLVTVLDTVPPSFFLVDTVTIDCSELNDPDADYLPSNVFDNCSYVITTYEDMIVGGDCNYTIDREYTFSDVCGNAISAMQHIIVSDNSPPEIIASPSDLITSCESNIITSFEIWVESYGGGIAQELCGTLMSFAAVPGSYNIDDPSTYPGESPGSLDNLGCGGSQDGFIFYEEVDFVYYDDCGNATAVKGAYGIRDVSPPVINFCPVDVMIQADSGMCSVIFPLPLIDYEDNCIESREELVQTITRNISSVDPGNENQIVNFVQLEFTDLSTSFLKLAGDAMLTLEINRADINDPNETFIIITEFNDTIGVTSLAEAQCGSIIDTFTVSKSFIEAIITDGDVGFVLIPSTPANASEGINDICPNSTVRATLSIPLNIDDIDNKSILVNGLLLQPSAIINNSIALDIGTHNIDHIVRDCANNSDTCSYSVTVIDSEPPTISCPGDTTFIIDGDSCFLDVILGAESFLVSDNCTLNKLYDTQLPVTEEGALFSFTFDEQSQRFSAQNVLLKFGEAFPINHTDMDATIEVTILANIDSTGQSIEIKGEDGSTIGIINDQNLNSCQLSRIAFPVSKDLINQWAVDSIIEVSIIPSSGGSSIPGCNDVNEEGTDGISLIKARLKYSDAFLAYEVEGDTNIPMTDFIDLENISFKGNAGNNMVTLVSEDIGGNQSSCSFNISIIDNVPPKAECKNAVVFLDPSGIEETVLDPILIDNGSNDNCSIDSMHVSPSVFNCSQLDEEIDVTLMVMDAEGNKDSCTSTIVLRTEVLQPSFEIGICDNDTLRLLANAPPAGIEDAYTFLWTGPDFTSVLENPVITNASPDNNGTYFLEITGFGGCITTGTIEVNVEQLSSPEITTEETEICIGDDVLLTAAGQTGNVSYNWYEGTYPNGLLIESTEAPSLLLTPSSGEHFYYIIIIKDGCESNPSPSKKVSVVTAPTASVNDEFVTICEDDALVLGTGVTGDNLSYQWLGPGGYNSNKQYPDTIFNVSSADEGIYRLVISIGSCHSDTASLQVTLFDKPATPEIISGDVFCEGSSISLSVNNIPNADLYTWFINGTQTSTTNKNTLVINNSSEELSGDWTVIATEGQCDSEVSPVKEITIESELLISANNDGPGCEGDSIQLSVSFVPGANYNWSGPQGFTSNDQSPMILAVGGEYFVTVTTPSGCDGESSTLLEVLTPPEITALSSDAFECMDGMTDITLFPSVFPQEEEYQYIWSGPAVFDTSVVNPVIENATEANNGIYTLVVSNENCESIMKAIELDITVIPEKPLIEGNTDYCVDDTITLSAVADGPATRYLWGTPQGQRFTDDPQLMIPMAEQVDMGMYSVVVLKGNCRSQASDPISINVESLPFPPATSANSPVCPGDSLQLNATAFRGATYLWTGPDGFSSTQQNPVIPEMSPSNAGVYIVTVSVGSCTDSSTPLEVELRESPLQPISEQEAYVICGSSTGGVLEICLDQGSTQPGNEYFIYNNATDELLANSSSICLTLNDLTSFESGSNFIYIIAEGPECMSTRSDLVRIDIIEPPIIDAEVEVNPIFVCDDSPVSVTSLFGPPEVIVEWLPVSENISLSNSNGKEIQVSDLNFGENILTILYSTDACKDFSSDTVSIFLDNSPQVRNDNYSLGTATPVLLDVFDNDFVPASAEVIIVEPPQFGDVEVLSDGIRFIPSPAFIGSTTFKYEICGIACDGLCAEGVVTLNIGNPGNCVAPTIFTPNNDNINDSFIIPCLYSGLYPQSKIQVYNQWGSIVYSADNYDNSWEGTHNGKALPVGTYYYILELDDISDKIIGFLILER